MGKSGVIGLDIGTTYVRAAEIEFGSKGPAGGPGTLRRYGQVALAPNAVRDGEVAESGVVSSALKELWSQARFSSRDVVIGVGNQRVLVRDLELPSVPLAQLRTTLPFHVQEMLPVAADDVLLDYVPTTEFDGQQGRMLRGLLVAAQRDTVNANILAVEGAGLRPRMVDLNALALLRAIVHGELAERTVAIVDVGARMTNVVVAAQGVPRLVRNIAAGGGTITDAVARSMAIAYPEAEQVKREVGIGFAPQAGREVAAEAIGAVAQNLVESIRNTFVYYASNNPGAGIDVVVLTGGGAQLPGFGQYLSSASRLPATLGDPLAALKFGGSTQRADLNGIESLVALPVGLAYGVAA